MTAHSRIGGNPLLGRDDAWQPPLPRRVCFLFTGQLHHVPHGLETAIALARIAGFEVDIAVSSRTHLDFIRPLLPEGENAPRLKLIGSALLRAVGTLRDTLVPPKHLTLLQARRELNAYAAIVVPERTSIAARALGIRHPRLIHIDHGAGDRAAGYDPRIAAFDFVLMAGAKQRDRMAREGLVRPDAHAVVGYPKFEAADRIRADQPYPFAQRKPVILYNPHFDADLGSWQACGLETIGRIVETGRYNLIFAPHVRLFEGRRAQRRAMRLLEPCIGRPDVHIDLGSSRSVDMSYTELADIYLGDVSSQVYEFLRAPRPCVFLNPRRTCWLGDENYGHWHFGRVIAEPHMLAQALGSAHADHQLFASVQQRGFERTFDMRGAKPSLRAASAIARYCWLNTG